MFYEIESRSNMLKENVGPKLSDFVDAHRVPMGSAVRMGRRKNQNWNRSTQVLFSISNPVGAAYCRDLDALIAAESRSHRAICFVIKIR
jgi:hypothetical protein